MSVPSRSSATRRILRPLTAAWPGSRWSGRTGSRQRRAEPRCAGRVAGPLDDGDARRAGQVRLEADGPAGEGLRGGRPERRALLVADLQQRHTAGCHPLGEDGEQAPDHVEPVRAPVERVARLEGRGNRQAGHDGRRDVGQVRADHVELVRHDQQARRPSRGRKQVGRDDRNPVPHRLRDRVLAGEIGRAVGRVGADDLHLAEHPPAAERHREGHGDGAAPGPDVGDGERRGARRARRAGQALGDRAEGEVHEHLRLGARDQGAGVDREGHPVELLEAANVGHRLAGRTPLHGVAQAPGRLGADRTLGVGEDRGPLHAQRVGQEQLGVEAGALRAARTQALDRGREKLADRRHRGVPQARAPARA